MDDKLVSCKIMLRAQQQKSGVKGRILEFRLKTILLSSGDGEGILKATVVHAIFSRYVEGAQPSG